MKYLAIDIETTGLDPQLHDILEFAAVYVDTEINIPIKERPSLVLITPNEANNYFVSPYCALLHTELWKIIESIEPTQLAEDLGYHDSVQRNGHTVTYPRKIPDCLAAWLTETVKHNLEHPLTLAGKNIQGFDLPFLLKDGYWDDIKFRHRALDPGPMYSRPETEQPPSLDDILKILGVPKIVKHRALDDCHDVIFAIERFWNRE